jgi:transcriptional regulator with XRE-family HTH domain
MVDSSPGELGTFLRARRARVQPEAVGLPHGQGFRRTPGLRREELAALAGVSIDYLTRLEQGKESNPSASVLDALARALLLDQDAHAHLYTLANQAAHRTPPRELQAESPSDTGIRPAVEQLIERLRPSPVYVLDQISNIRAANPEAVALFAGLGDWPRARWNTIRYLFLHPAAHDLFLDWQDVAADALAHLRSRLANPAADSTAASALIEELSATSQEFQRLWNRYDVRPRRSRPKNFQHPAAGKLRLHQEILYLSDDGLRMNVYQANPGSADENTLTLLSLSTRGQPGPVASGRDHPLHTQGTDVASATRTAPTFELRGHTGP